MTGMKYTSDMLRTMRSVISELALGPDGEYEAFLLVQIKDETTNIFEDPAAYNETLRKVVPKEFWNMTVLWWTGLWGKQYPKLPEGSRNVHASQWLPTQYFLKKYPAFDYYWNWEMDVRYTGHHYELLESLTSWSRKQPRKGLWERNARFYVPKYHGDYSTDFKDYIQDRYRSGSGEKKEDLTIWGPLPPAEQGTTYLDDLPPLESPTPSKDNFTWGVGEEADLITLLPMFSPDTTHYSLRDSHFNYPSSLLPSEPPRRATIITFYRFSHRLLSTMEQENVHSLGHHMSSEQWSQSMCLHHGFNAVHAPHSLYMERQWPAKALNFIFNNGDSERVIKAFKDMPALVDVVLPNRSRNTVIQAALGYKIDGIGGVTWEAKHGTYCLPPMLLHQIKDMEDPAIATADETHELEAAIKEEQFQEEKANAESDALKAAKAGGASVHAT
ncbi:hypothetical protein MMC30_001352 [Trapelia coarctata]|nr:hypothetical protein [Trapelia coarctata]